MDARIAAPLASLSEPTRLAGGTALNYSFGMFKVPIRSRMAIMHAGSDAGLRALPISYPAEDASIVIVSDGSVDLTPVHDGQIDIFLNGGVDAPAFVKPSATHLSRLAGY